VPACCVYLLSLQMDKQDILPDTAATLFAGEDKNGHVDIRR
jgi:hypothetical protein